MTAKTWFSLVWPWTLFLTHSTHTLLKAFEVNHLLVLYSPLCLRKKNCIISSASDTILRGIPTWEGLLCWHASLSWLWAPFVSCWPKVSLVEMKNSECWLHLQQEFLCWELYLIQNRLPSEKWLHHIKDAVIRHQLYLNLLTKPLFNITNCLITCTWLMNCCFAIVLSSVYMWN